MDIAAMSIGMSTASVVQQASLSMAKKTMNMQEEQAAGLIDMMRSATPAAPPSGHKLDVRA